MKRHIGILPCIVTFPGQRDLNIVYGDNGVQRLFDPNWQYSLTSYVNSVAGGAIELTAQVYPTMIVESSAIGQAIESGDRTTVAELLWDAAELNGIHMRMFHGAVFFTLGREADAGAVTIKREGVQPGAVLTDRGTHSFFAHELMHLLGFDHAFLTSDERSYKNGEYADPTCIMSAENWGGRAVSFALPADADTNGDGIGDQSTIQNRAHLWQRGGPGLSAASLWRYYPGFPAQQTWTRFVSPHEPAVHVSLAIPSARQGTKLAVMPDLFGAGWYAVERRTAGGWDRGLRHAATGESDTAGAAGVIIHRIHDVGVAEDGAGWPKVDRVCYEGTIPVPSTGNDDWTNGMVSVRVTGDDGSGVLVGRTFPPGQAVRLELSDQVEDTRDVPGGNIISTLVGPTCGRGELSTIDRQTTYTVAVIAAATGFTQPAFRFLLNDQPVGEWSAIVVPVRRQGNEPTNVMVERPVAYQETRVEPGIVNIGWDIAGNRLTFAVPGGDGRFPLKISVEVADATLPETHRVPRVSASMILDLRTSEITLTEASRKKIQECGTYLGSWKTVKEYGPDDLLGPVAIVEDWNSLDRDQLRKAIGDLELLSRAHARVARDVVKDSATQLGVSEGVLIQSIRRLQKYGVR